MAIGIILCDCAGRGGRVISDLRGGVGSIALEGGFVFLGFACVLFVP